MGGDRITAVAAPTGNAGSTEAWHGSGILYSTHTFYMAPALPPHHTHMIYCGNHHPLSYEYNLLNNYTDIFTGTIPRRQQQQRCDGGVVYGSGERW